MKLKLLFICLIAYPTLLISQSKLEIEAQDFFWGENDNYKNAVDIPEKWQNESAVIIYKNENYDFHKFGKRVEYKSSLRKRIKLLDQASVTEFSTFTYQKRFSSSKGYSGYKASHAIVGLKVVKQDGTETIVDIEKEAVEVDGETKIAIANLEIGDILDFYYYSVEPFKSIQAFGFEPVEQTLGEEYPIMDYKLYFQTENDFFINFNSYNGAPELTEIPVKKNNTRRYELVANNIEKHKYERWFYPLVELPTYKFQVYFARSGKFEDRALAFLPEKEDIIKKTVSKEEVLDYYEKYTPLGDLGSIERFIKDNNFESEREKVIAVYYFARHKFLTQYVEAIIVNEAEILANPFIATKTNPHLFRNDQYFVRHFMAFLYDFKYDYDVIVGKKRYDGDLNELLIQKNANILLRVNTSPPVYLDNFKIHSDVNQFNYLMEGTDVYELSAKKKRLDQITTGKLPQTSYDQNESYKEVTISLNDDFSGFNYQGINKYKGYEKVGHQFDKLMFKDYVVEDYEKYETEPFIEQIRNKKSRAKTKKELDALVVKLREKQSENLKESVASELDIEDVTDYTFSIEETGRYGFDTYFTYNESFNTSDQFIKKAGPNYILEVGKFIGGQVDLTDEDRKRVENIYMNYPRSYNYNITVNIPEGYSVSGLEKLNKSIENKTGAFISSATIEGNQIIITTTKQYKNNYEDNADWPLMMEFLDEAFQFTNEKILLKKS
ncbi:hypothetical protein OS188_11745 [Xanthomarina sp. F1114]|uniref:hypothetical protein n=1 Tax=Xanthomarina sp. F1114 TaxID=2996019 RepID=UPI00225DD332|nr:hypothetical protein [Xanthomarina sp. F1114]MCX7548624.1 hypothetical protein [Xanthomarina sp. F1114]